MLYAEDLAVGQRFQLGTYTIGEAELLEFARKYDPVPIHTDPDAAAAGPFGGLIASGFNTIAIYQRLVVEAVWSRSRRSSAGASRSAFQGRSVREPPSPDSRRFRKSPSGLSGATQS
jgi:acyl dehydratase